MKRFEVLLDVGASGFRVWGCGLSCEPLLGYLSSLRALTFRHLIRRHPLGFLWVSGLKVSIKSGTQP